jgi:hypothetical protein
LNSSLIREDFGNREEFASLNLLKHWQLIVVYIQRLNLVIINTPLNDNAMG